MGSQLVTRDQWLKARKVLLAEEKRVMRLNDELTAARRALPAVKIDADYIFSSEDGPVSLKGLFGKSRQLKASLPLSGNILRRIKLGRTMETHDEFSAHQPWR